MEYCDYPLSLNPCYRNDYDYNEDDEIDYETEYQWERFNSWAIDR